MTNDVREERELNLPVFPKAARYRELFELDMRENLPEEFDQEFQSLRDEYLDWQDANLPLPADDAEQVLVSLIGRCCGDRAGSCHCEMFGCQSLLEILRVVRRQKAKSVAVATAPDALRAMLKEWRDILPKGVPLHIDYETSSYSAVVNRHNETVASVFGTLPPAPSQGIAAHGRPWAEFLVRAANNTAPLLDAVESLLSERDRLAAEQITERNGVSRVMKMRDEEIALLQQKLAIEELHHAETVERRDNHEEALNRIFVALGMNEEERTWSNHNNPCEQAEELAEAMFLPEKHRLECGHDASLLVKSVESDHHYCDLCESRDRLRDALTMEGELRQERNQQAAELTALRQQLRDAKAAMEGAKEQLLLVAVTNPDLSIQSKVDVLTAALAQIDGDARKDSQTQGANDER